MAFSCDRTKYATYCCLCCCGGLPIVAVIKAAITIPFALLMHCVPTTLIALLLLPHDIFLTYRALMATNKIGRNLKFGGMLLLPFCLVSWPIMVCFVSCVVAVFYPLCLAMAGTFSDDSSLFFSGSCCYPSCDTNHDTSDTFLGNPLPKLMYWVVDFWDMNYHNLFGVTEELRHHRLSDGEKPFDVPILKVLLGFVQGCLCLAFALCVNTITFAIKFPIFALAGLFASIKWPLEEASGGGLWLLMLPLSLGISVGLVWPFLLAACILLQLVLLPLSIGASSALASYNHDSLYAGFQSCMYLLSKYNGQFVRAILFCLPDVCLLSETHDGPYMYMPHCGNPEQRKPNGNAQQGTANFTFEDNYRNARDAERVAIVSHRATPALSTAGTTLRVASNTEVFLKLSLVYNNLFKEIGKLLLEGLTFNYITKTEVLSAIAMSPNHELCNRMIVAASIQLAIRSLQHKDVLNQDDLLMSDGTVVTKENVPTGQLARAVHPYLTSIKRDLRDCLELYNVVLECKGGAAPATVGVDSVEVGVVVEDVETGAAKDNTGTAIEKADVLERRNCWPGYFKYILNTGNPTESGNSFGPNSGDGVTIIENGDFDALFTDENKLKPELARRHEIETLLRHAFLMGHELASHNIGLMFGFRRNFAASARVAINDFSSHQQ